MDAEEIARDIIVETLNLSIKSFSEIGVTAMETNENVDNATKKIEQCANQKVIDELEYLDKYEDEHKDCTSKCVIEKRIKELKK